MVSVGSHCLVAFNLAVDFAQLALQDCKALLDLVRGDQLEVHLRSVAWGFDWLGHTATRSITVRISSPLYQADHFLGLAIVYVDDRLDASKSVVKRLAQLGLVRGQTRHVFFVALYKPRLTRALNIIAII